MMDMPCFSQPVQRCSAATSAATGVDPSFLLFWQYLPFAADDEA